MPKVLGIKPETEMKIRIGHALNVRPEMLEDIGKWADGSFQVSDIRGICKDDAIRNFATLDALCGYNNDPDGELFALEFSMKDSQENRVFARIGGESNFVFRSENAYFSIEGENGICIQLRSNIRSDMKSYRPWYWPLSWVTFGALMVAYWVLVTPYLVLRITGLIELDTAIHVTANVNSILSAIVLLIPGLWVLVKLGNLLKKHIFPPVTFSIGHGKQRDEYREWIRRSIVSATALAGLTSLGSLLY